FSLREKRQQQFSVLGEDLLDSENAQCLSHIQHFRNGWRLFQTPSSQRARQPSDLPVKSLRVASRLNRENFLFSSDRWVIESDIETTSPKWMSNWALLVGCKDDNRNGLRLHRSELWNGELPVAEDFEEERLKLLIDFVDFIDQKYTGLRFVQERSK